LPRRVRVSLEVGMKRARFPRWRRFQERHSLPEILAAAFVFSILAISVTAGAQVSKKLDQPRLAAPNTTKAGQTTKKAVTTKAGQVGALTASPQQRSPLAISPKRVDPSAKATDPDDEDDDGDAEPGAGGATVDLAVHVNAGGTAAVTLLKFGSDAGLADGAEAFGKALGCPLRRVVAAKTIVQYRADDCRMAVRRSGLRYQGKLNLAPLFGPLRQANVNRLSVSVWQDARISMECSPRPAIAVTTSVCQYAILFSPIASAPGMDARALSRAKFFQTTDTLPKIELSYGLTRAEIARAGAVLGIVLLLPIVVTLWMRRAALGAADRIAAGLRTADATSDHAGSVHDDRAGIWFGYWRSLNWVLNGSLFLWWGVSDTVNLNGLLAMVLPSGESGQTAWAFHLADRIGFWLPPLVVVAICQTLSHPVQVRVRGLQWTRGEVLKQSVWSMAASWLPLLLFLNGLNELVVGNSRVGVIWMTVAFFGRTYAARQSALAQGLTPRALTAGDLRDSIFGMATKLKVKLVQVYVVATGKARLANAFARTGNSILLTDTLLGSLNRREVDAIVAHELAHLKHEHPRKLGSAYILGFVAAIALVTLLPTGGMLLRPFRYLLFLVVPQAITYFFSRRFEYTADKEAVLLTGDAEAQITSLVKLHRLNLMPLDWGRVQGKFLTHPSTRLRARAIARAGGIPEERVPEILERALRDQGSTPAMEPADMLTPSFSGATVPTAIAEHEGADRGLSPVAPIDETAHEFSSAPPPQPSFTSPLAGAIQAQATDITSASDSPAQEASGNTAIATLEAPAETAPSPALADSSAVADSSAGVDHAPVMPAPATPAVSARPGSAAADQYSLPASAGGEEKVFSSTYKHRNAFRNAWIFISSLVFPPALIALALHHSHLAGRLREGAYAAGWVVALVFSLAVRDRLLSWEAPLLRRHLREKMEKDGADPGTWGGRFVGLSPHAVPRSYESMSVWDIGYLYVYPDRICYWGEEARFALTRSQVTALRLAAGPPGWFGPQSIYVTWQDGENAGTFNFRVGDVSSTHEMARQTRLFAERLQSWVARPPYHRDLPPALAKLGTPQFGAVTGASPGAGTKPRAIFGTTILLWFVGWAVSVLFGLPVLGVTYPVMYLTLLMSSAAASSAVRNALWAAMPPAPGWYVILTAWTIYLVHTVPNWLYREPKTPSVSAPS
jgi:Zn-dependent protease with chaperone function